MKRRGFFMEFFIDSLTPDEVFDGGVEGGEGVGEAEVEGDFGGDALAIEEESGLIAEEGCEQQAGHVLDVHPGCPLLT